MHANATARREGLWPLFFVPKKKKLRKSLRNEKTCVSLRHQTNKQTMTYTQEQLEKVKGFDAIELKQQFEDRILEIEKTLQNEIMAINGLRYELLVQEKNQLKIDRCKIRVF